MPDLTTSPIFGDLGPFTIDQHTESMRHGRMKLTLQTSSGQTDDGKAQSWSVRLSVNGADFAKGQFELVPLEEARTKAREWMKEQLAGLADG